MPFLFFCSKDVTEQHSKNRVQEDATECPYSLLDILRIIHAEVTKISRRDWSPEIQKIDSRYVTQIWLFLLYRQSKTDISEVFWPVTVTVTSCINCIVILYCQGVKDLEVVNRFVSGQVMKEVLRTTADALCSSKSDSVLFGSSLVRPWMCFLIANPSILCQGNLMHAVKRPVVLSPSENLLATLNKRLVCMMATHISHQTYCVHMVCGNLVVIVSRSACFEVFVQFSGTSQACVFEKTRPSATDPIPHLD